MHQPDYRDRNTGHYELPWTYLHAIKDYVDMAAHLEALPAARAVVNFAPILLQQIDDYSHHIQQYLNHGKTIPDDLLSALVSPELSSSSILRLELIEQCLKVNEQRLIKRFPAYDALASFARTVLSNNSMMVYVNELFISDLVVWHHLAWLGETLRRRDIRIKRLMDKKQNYSLRDRRELLIVIGEQLKTVIERYRRLVENGQIEVSLTPYAHPIVPLMLDIKSAKQSIPDVVLPDIDYYPGGAQRANWHIQKGIEVFKKYFGFVPNGCWPSEGSVSDDTLKLLAEHGFLWTATGETVLHNSIAKPENNKPENYAHRAYKFSDNNNNINVFFRNDGLSDNIGFKYYEWHADDAVADLAHHLKNIALSIQDTSDDELNDHVVAIILDGENAWEHYPENAYYFLSGLYATLSSQAEIRLTTFSECLQTGMKTPAINTITAGSWVYGSFSTWIGDADKNRCWEVLTDVKKVYDQVMSEGRLNEQQVSAAEHQLAVCEGSDWAWWFGDYNSESTVNDFDRLYRKHLKRLYHLLQQPCPDYLELPFSKGGGDPTLGGAMRPGQA
ncbi:Amylopullulanase [hydrothermal vent metagenome]|uniref:Amylopullulanase n=1 Tax=hydrothermal vent metagenome TaxID=652676 RepID=A0A3B1A9R3_9ZZZZ